MSDVEDWWKWMQEYDRSIKPAMSVLFFVRKDAPQAFIEELINAKPGSVIKGYQEGFVTIMPLYGPEGIYDYIAGLISEEQ